MSLSEYKNMETTKETTNLESIFTSYEKMLLESLEVEEAHSLKFETSSQNTEIYYAISLPQEDSETYVDVSLPTEESQNSLFEIIKEEITTFFNIQKIEVSDTLPFIEIHKEAMEDGKAQ